LVVALKVLVEGVEAGVGQEMAEGFVVAVARGEVKAAETAKIEDGSAGAGLVGGVGLSSRNAVWDFGFVFAEEGIGGVGHRIGSFCVSCEQRCRLGDAGLSEPRSGDLERLAGTSHYLRGEVKKGGRGRVFNAIMETLRL
jgi:hypothetical protein